MILNKHGEENKGLIIILDEQGKQNNKKTKWIPMEHLIEARNIRIELPNGKKKDIDKGWYVNKEYSVELFRYGALEITDKCNVKCSGFCVRSAKRTDSIYDLNFITLDFAKRFSRLAAANNLIIKERYGFTQGSENSYGNPNWLKFEDFTKTHVNRRMPQSTICVSGGEPTEHKHYKEILTDILKITDGSDIRVVFATNLTNSFNNGFFSFFEELSRDYNGNVELQLSYNSALVDEYYMIAGGSEKYRHLRGNIPVTVFKGDPKHTLIRIIDHVLCECERRGIFAVLRITKDEQRNEFLETDVIKYFLNARNIKHIVCYGEKPQQTRFNNMNGTEIHYYVAPVARAGFAGNKRKDNYILEKTFPDEIYISAEGRIYPHMAWCGLQFGWIGISRQVS